MAKGLSLSIGLNAVDPHHYGGWSGGLLACEADANDMAEIARSRKFTARKLLTKAATRAKVASEITRAAGILQPGDIFLLSYSGHGGQLPDLSDDEPDGQDETWCLYDGELVDDELYAYLGKFRQRVRILMFSDSCHSGSVAKAAYFHGTSFLRAAGFSTQEVRYRMMPSAVAQHTYREHKGFYDKILKESRGKNSEEAVKASVLLISGCQDNQLSADGDFNGLFTSQVLSVWKHGLFKGNYRKFHKEILRRMPPDQTPKYFRVGPIDKEFEGQSPFTV